MTSVIRREHLRPFVYRVEIDVESDEALGEEELRDGFTCDEWSFEGLGDGPISTYAVKLRALHGTEFRIGTHNGA